MKKILLSSFALSTLLIFASCSKPAPEAEITEDTAEATNTVAMVAAPTIVETEEVSEETKELLEKMPDGYKTANLQSGKQAFAVCMSCHSIKAGDPAKTGPNLYSIFGRKAGSVAGYDYSAGLKSSGITWDFDKLDAYITNPKAMISDSKMMFAGIANPEKRKDLVAYLKIESEK